MSGATVGPNSKTGGGAAAQWYVRLIYLTNGRKKGNKNSLLVPRAKQQNTAEAVRLVGHCTISLSNTVRGSAKLLKCSVDPSKEVLGPPKE